MLNVNYKINQTNLLVDTIVFLVKDDAEKNDYKSYKFIYFNYFLTSYKRIRLFPGMQVRVMTACMESL